MEEPLTSLGLGVLNLNFDVCLIILDYMMKLVYPVYAYVLF